LSLARVISERNSARPTNLSDEQRGFVGKSLPAIQPPRWARRSASDQEWQKKHGNRTIVGGDLNARGIDCPGDWPQACIEKLWAGVSAVNQSAPTVLAEPRDLKSPESVTKSRD
jgi:hypothetical protein